MPFTPSHAAAALPFLRAPLLPAAVVIGTMAPDVPYYVPLGIPRGVTHTPIGMLTVDIVITAVLFVLWYAFLRAPVVDLAPRVVRVRMPERGPGDWRGSRTWPAAIGLLALSALVGITTHVVWDAFTHRGWLPSVVPALEIQLGPLPLFSWLQHLSTVAGLALLAGWTARWVRRTPPIAGRVTTASAGARAAAWIALAAAFGLAGALTWAAGLLRGREPLEPGLVFVVAVAAVAAAGLATVVVCSTWWIARLVRRGDREAPAG